MGRSASSDTSGSLQYELHVSIEVVEVGCATVVLRITGVEEERPARNRLLFPLRNSILAPQNLHDLQRQGS